MYLQITTKCNFMCAHCCYSCNKNGKHGDLSIIKDAISFARNYDNEMVAIGGGEPTLHPEFFDILAICMNSFDYIWMATNGSNRKAMWRIHNILQDCDYENFPEDGWDYAPIIANTDKKLTVALSQDYFHDVFSNKVDEKIVDLWDYKSNNRVNGYEIRNVTNSNNGVINIGRAKRTQVGMTDKNCICSDLIIKPDGTIKMCGCPDSPTIGDIYVGIQDQYEKLLQSDSYMDERCWKATEIHTK